MEPFCRSDLPVGHRTFLRGSFAAFKFNTTLLVSFQSNPNPIQSNPHIPSLQPSLVTCISPDRRHAQPTHSASSSSRPDLPPTVTTRLPTMLRALYSMHAPVKLCKLCSCGTSIPTTAVCFVYVTYDSGNGPFGFDVCSAGWWVGCAGAYAESNLFGM